MKQYTVNKLDLENSKLEGQSVNELIYALQDYKHGGNLNRVVLVMDGGAPALKLINDVTGEELYYSWS